MSLADRTTDYAYRTYIDAKRHVVDAFWKLPLSYQYSEEVVDAFNLLQGALDDTYYELRQEQAAHPEADVPF